VSPVALRALVEHVLRALPGTSERRACKVLGQPRSTQRLVATKSDTDRPLVAAMTELVGKNPRFGYRRIHVMLEAEGFRVGRDRVHRLWRKHGFKVPRKTHKRRRLGSAAGGITRHAAMHIDHVWTYDFVKDQTQDGRSVKILTVVDEYTRECLAAPVARSITGRGVVDLLRELFTVRGVPRHIRSDNGPEFIANKVRAWLEENKVGPLFIEPGAPWQNAIGESFNGKLRDECLKLELFTSLAEARVVIEDFRLNYNHRRPHSSLDYRTPAAFAAACRQAPPLSLATLALAPSPACTRREESVHSVPLI
jgi:putative transposase